MPLSGNSRMSYYRIQVENGDGVIPVEVKAKNGTTVSFDRALRTASVPYRYKFISGNVGVMAGKISLPHYMAMFVRPVQ